MTAKYFVDTNILVYFRDSSEPKKQLLAKNWLSELWRLRTGRLSIQVLNEYYVTVTQRLKPGLSQDEARADIRNLFAWKPVNLNRALIVGAWTIQDRYVLSWWDSLIVSAAQQANCVYLLSEDMQHNQSLDGLTVINPFFQSPDNLGVLSGR